MTEEQTKIEALIAKVAQLRKLAASTSSEAERDTAMRAAAKLMELHRIEESAIEEANDEAEVFATALRTATPLIVGARVETWRIGLTIALAEHFGCAVVRARQRGTFAGRTSVELFGRPSDLALLRSMFAWVEPEIAHRARLHASRASYLIGAAHGIATQLRAAKAEARREAAATSTALVRLDNRAHEARLAMRGENPGLRERTLTSGARLTREGYEAGFRDGATMNIHGGARALGVR